MFRMTRLCNSARLGALTLLVILALAGSALAGDKGSLAFAPGTSSATVKGEIQGMDRDTYTLVAKAGQTMQVSVKNAKKLVLFQIQLPGSEDAYLPGAGTEDDATSFQGKLPKSGMYTIVVGAMKGSDTRYSLTVAIKN
jgi:hypothetical protein